MNLFVADCLKWQILFQCRWCIENMDKIDPCQTTTKDNKGQTVCIILQLYCVSGVTALWHCFDLLPDDVIKWKPFPGYWPFVRGIHRSPVNSPHKGQWRGALMFSLICVWINGWVNNREAGDLRCYRAHYDVIVMLLWLDWSESGL